MESYVYCFSGENCIFTWTQLKYSLFLWDSETTEIWWDELHLHPPILIFAEMNKKKKKKDFSVSTSSATDCLVQIDLSCNCHLCLRAHLSILQHYTSEASSLASAPCFCGENIRLVLHPLKLKYQLCLCQCECYFIFILCIMC